MNPQTITIPAAGNAAGVVVTHATGKYFLVTATNGTFRVITSHGDEYSFSETNSGFGNDQSPTFGKLTFYNDSGAAVTITFYVSTSPIKTSDVNLTQSVTVTTVLQNTLANCALENEGQFQASSGAAGAAAAFAAPGTYYRQAILVAQRSLARVANTGNVYIGIGAGAQPIPIPPGGQYAIQADTGGKRDFGSWYVSADVAGDGVSVVYV
jgi:hypothetical protein